MNTKRILFVGNSYTNRNDMPDTFARLAASSGADVSVRRVTSGGKTLQWHAGNPDTLAALRDESWDIVVLQEQSVRPIDAPDSMMAGGESVASLAGDARLVLYLTWARLHRPETQPALNDSYAELARRTNASIAPVGPAWHRAFGQRPGLVLHAADRSHPNAHGSYLAACVFHAAILGGSPVGLTNACGPEGGAPCVVDEEMATFLQNVAWETWERFGRDGRD